MVVPPAEWEEVETTNKSLVAWTAVPAVHMPTVLTVADGKFKTVCIPPSLIAALPILIDPTAVGFTLPLSTFFSGTNLTFTINFGPPDNDDGSLAIVGGNLVGTPPYPSVLGGGYSGLTITATNTCGTATSNVFAVGLQ
jgi:hypothetical protein